MNFRNKSIWEEDIIDDRFLIDHNTSNDKFIKNFCMNQEESMNLISLKPEESFGSDPPSLFFEDYSLKTKSLRVDYIDRIQEKEEHAEDTVFVDINLYDKSENKQISSDLFEYSICAQSKLKRRGRPHNKWIIDVELLYHLVNKEFIGKLQSIELEAGKCKKQDRNRSDEIRAKIYRAIKNIVPFILKKLTSEGDRKKIKNQKMLKEISYKIYLNLIRIYAYHNWEDTASLLESTRPKDMICITLTVASLLFKKSDVIHVFGASRLEETGVIRYLFPSKTNITIKMIKKEKECKPLIQQLVSFCLKIAKAEGNLPNVVKHLEKISNL